MADGADAVGRYAAFMAYPQPATWLADAFAPLEGTFGDRLRFARDGAVARWSYAGHAAIVELRGEDRIVARFVAPPEMDTVSGGPAAPVYQRYRDGYALTRAGCERMVSDMVAFFSGIREPRFTFVAAD
ncbi:MAG TPA: hypothetical protein VGX96_11560 [Candidatus Elarobacter sp.]|nr:hypothetical protein [Candidatus Elarobacter sp.]